jgi:hypothetical protein
MIPKIHHEVWTSNNPFAPKFHEWRLSWMRLNPDWNFKLWKLDELIEISREKIIDNSIYLMLSNPCLHYVLKSDIARFLVTWLEGGVYSDCDIECWKPMDIFLDNVAFCGRSVTPGISGNGVIGCVPRHEYFLKIAVEMSKKISLNIDDANKTIVDYGVNFAGEMLLNCDKIYPSEYFSPVTPAYRMQNKNHVIKSTNYPDSYCFHYWSGTDIDGWYTETIGKGKQIEIENEEDKKKSWIFYGRNALKGK